MQLPNEATPTSNISILLIQSEKVGIVVIIKTLLYCSLVRLLLSKLQSKCISAIKKAITIKALSIV